MGTGIKAAFIIVLIKVLKDVKWYGLFKKNYARMYAAWALERITGQNFGKKAGMWQNWWKQNKNSLYNPDKNDNAADR